MCGAKGVRARDAVAHVVVVIVVVVFVGIQFLMCRNYFHFHEIIYGIWFELA